MEYDFNSMINRIKAVKKEKNITNAKLSEISGVPYGTLNKILGSETKEPSINVIIKISIAFGVSTDYIVSGEIKATPNVQFSSDETNIIKKYRELDIHGRDMVDTVIEKEYERCTAVIEEENPEIIQIKLSQLPASAGTGVDLCEENYQIMSIRASDLARQADFAVRVSGDSMETTFYDGDILLIESMPFINKGDIGIFVLNGDGYVKEYGGDRLISHNSKYPDIKLTEHDVVICSGRVIGVLEEDDFIN